MSLDETPLAGDPGHLSAHAALHVQHNKIETINPHFLFTYSGALQVWTGLNRVYLPWNITLLAVTLSLGVVSSGANVIADVLVDGVTVFTTPANRPEITAGAFTTTTSTIEDASHTAGQYLTADIVQVGSTDPGEWLTWMIEYRGT